MSTLIRPITVLVAAAGVILQAGAMTSEEWYDTHTVSVGDWYACHAKPAHSLTNTITVGDSTKEGSTVNTKDLLKKKITSYTFPAGAVLTRTGDIWTLKLSGNVTIGGDGISASRSLVIELAPGSYTHVAPTKLYKNGNPLDAYGVRSGCGLLITGPGTLSVSHAGEKGAGISTGNVLAWEGDLLITDGAFVRVQSPNVNAVTASNTNYGNKYDFYPHYVAVVGALLETTSGKVFSQGDVFFRRSAVNLLGNKIALEAGRLEITESFVAAMALTGNAIKVRKGLTAEKAIVYGVSRDDDGLNIVYTSQDDENKIGRGLYKFATLGGSGKAAINFAYPLTVNGGEIHTCAPGGYGINSVLRALKMESGLVRNQYSMHLKDEFFASRELMDAYGLVAGWEALGYETAFNPLGMIGIFLGTTLLDWFEANAVNSPEGNAHAAMATASFEMSGGTIITEASDVGVILREGYSGSYYDEPVISGGSFRGPMCYYDTWGTRHGLNEAVFERASVVGENAVVCVTNTVAGKPYSHVTSGWTAQLPSDYDTSSLYLDGENKLYFWVPEEYARKSQQTSCDLGFYVLSSSGWGDSLFVTSVSEGTSSMTAIEQGAPIYLKYAFKNLVGNSDVSGFVNRFTLSTGAVFDHRWTDATLHAGKVGWGGDSYSPSPLQNLAPGTYTLTCTLDATDALTETNEGNNTKSIVFSVVAPGSGGGSGGGGSDPIKIYYSVYFDENGGGRGSVRSVRSGEAVGALSAPTRTGYTFVGWFTAATGGVKISESTKITQSTTFYAHWTANGSGVSNGSGTIVVSAPVPLSVEAGDVLHMTFSRVGGNQGSIAVKAKTQTSTALMGVGGSADFDYVKTVMTWADGDSTTRTIDVPTYVQPWEGTKQLRVKLSTLATGTYAGNLVPNVPMAKIYVDLENPSKFGTVSVAPQVANPVAGNKLRLVFRRTGGSDWPIAVKYKVQTSTAVAGVDFDYVKDVVVWNNGEDDVQYVDVQTYPSAAGKQLRVKLSTLTQGAYEGCVTPHVENAKVYIPLY